MAEAEITKKGDFVEIKYSGYSQGKLFDSNVEEDLKKIDSEAKVQQTIVVIGQKMVVHGFDSALEGKEIGKDYEVSVGFKEGFGERKRDLVKTIPLNAFHAQKVEPKPGMVFTLDNSIARIIAVSGARVVTDFNNPMAGKDLAYKFKIIRKVNDENEKAKTLLDYFLRVVPEFEIKEDSVVVKGPKILEEYIRPYSGRFKEIMNKELKFELKEMPKEKHDGKHEVHEHNHEGHEHENEESEHDHKHN